MWRENLVRLRLECVCNKNKLIELHKRIHKFLLKMDKMEQNSGS